MTDNRIWSMAKAGRGLGVVGARRQPSHIHIPRPSRVMRADDPGTSAHRPVACLQARGDAYRELRSCHALDDLVLAGDRR